MFVPTMTTPRRRHAGPPCATLRAAENAHADMVARHIRRLPLRDLISSTVLADGEVRVGGATFRIEPAPGAAP